MDVNSNKAKAATFGFLEININVCKAVKIAATKV